ncbi:MULTISPECIES: cobalt-precorrin-6A reductase [unclassified Gordonia (in: high G+C Gram-positive bacteria)]|uniref:cobalt-precorrin-6A reductase n=1 Tax=unclassified Gordonia (in: high G+C Gram-positive bacteria) TaxID=2657482 RepID=UPI0024B51D8E|nr:MULTISPECIES: cobalt-precorrin-6A reductase [unclassified Gordonia (in: high G+C Gram-positive bacteria)]
MLILGGTAEARALAKSLVAQDIPVISSLAGRVQNPRLPLGEVRIGGFGGVDGLANWLRANHIRAVVDATHPFAARITANAVAAGERTGTPLLRLARPEWTPGPGDRWTRVPDIAAAARVVADRGGRVFLTTGRQDAHAFAAVDGAWFLIRVVDPPSGPLPPHHEILAARGPYGLDDERALLAGHAITLLVTKNSGGELTRAKLTAAAEAGLEVVMVDRPAEPVGLERRDSVAAVLDWLVTAD